MVKNAALENAKGIREGDPVPSKAVRNKQFLAARRRRDAAEMLLWLQPTNKEDVKRHARVQFRTWAVRRDAAFGPAARFEAADHRDGADIPRGAACWIWR